MPVTHAIDGPTARTREFFDAPGIWQYPTRWRTVVPVIVDGNNLLFAARDAEGSQHPIGRSLLCQALGRWASRCGENVHVVFDGRAPRSDLAEQIGDARIRVSYSGSESADAVLIGFLEHDSAARRLRVVSSDREIIRAARRRRARPVRSQDFWAELQRDLSRLPPPRLEPPEKRRGLEPEQTEQWLRDFGFDDDPRDGTEA